MACTSEEEPVPCGLILRGFTGTQSYRAHLASPYYPRMAFSVMSRRQFRRFGASSLEGLCHGATTTSVSPEDPPSIRLAFVPGCLHSRTSGRGNVVFTSRDRQPRLRRLSQPDRCLKVAKDGLR